VIEAAQVAERLFDFADPASADAWSPIGDPVMGGVSSGGLFPVEGGAAAFVGEVSLERGGGFASVRSAPGRFDLSRHERLFLDVRGDGKVYKLSLRTDPFLDGVSYQAPFATKAGAWISVELTLSSFRATWRGRPVPGAPPLDPSAVTTFGLLVSGRQAGPFRLEIAAIRAGGPGRLG